MSEIKKFVDGTIEENKVAVFSKSFCPYCHMAKEALNETGVKYKVIELDTPEYGELLQGGGGLVARSLSVFKYNITNVGQWF